MDNKEIKMEEELEINLLAHEGMSYEEISELNEKLLREIRKTDIELGTL